MDRPDQIEAKEGHKLERLLGSWWCECGVYMAGLEPAREALTRREMRDRHELHIMAPATQSVEPLYVPTWGPAAHHLSKAATQYPDQPALFWDVDEQGCPVYDETLSAAPMCPPAPCRLCTGRTADGRQTSWEFCRSMNTCSATIDWELIFHGR
jgi:hypothetical protein